MAGTWTEVAARMTAARMVAPGSCNDRKQVSLSVIADSSLTRLVDTQRPSGRP